MNNDEQNAALEQAQYEGWPVVYYVRSGAEENKEINYIERELDKAYVYVIFYSDEDELLATDA